MIASQSLDWWRPEAAAVTAAQTDAIVDAEDRRGIVAFRALLAFTFVLVIAPQEIIPALGALRPALLAALVAIAAHLRDRGAARSAGHPRELVLAAVLLGWSVVTIPLSMWPGGSVTLLSDLFIKALIAFWLVGVVVDRVERLRSLFWALAIMSVPLAVTGLRHYAAGEFTPDAITRIQGYRSALAGNPNDLALMLDIIMPLTAALILTTRGLAAKAALLGILCLDAATVIATFSRGGFITLIAMVVVAVPWLVRRLGFTPIGVMAVTGLLALAVIPPGYVDRVLTIVDIDSDPTHSAQERWRDMIAAVQLATDHPVIGAGIGMDAIALNDVRGRTWRSVHNAYLNYAVDLGLPGLVLFVALLVSAIRTARRVEWRAGRLHSDQELATLAGGVKVGLVGYAVAALVYPTAYQFYFYYLAGLAVALGTISHTRHQPL